MASGASGRIRTENQNSLDRVRLARDTTKARADPARAFDVVEA
jgi:hypothetical protein